MQHLDEGTIHSWLDGALSAEEAARVEAHVKECPQCAAAVAEARGFIAGASRILTALDNAPRGVIPVAAPKKRFDPLVWRVAATVLVVASASLLLFRDGGREAQNATLSADSAGNATGPSAVTTIAPAAPNDEALKENGRLSPPIARPLQAAAESKSPTTKQDNVSIKASQPSVGLTEKGVAKGVAGGTVTGVQAMAGAVSGVPYPGGKPSPASPKITAHENQAVADQDRSVTTGNAPTSSGYAGAAAASPVAIPPVATLPIAPQALRISGAISRDALSGQTPLKVVGNPKMIGAKVTLYEVSPGDTVTLREELNLRLEAVVVTGAAAARQAPQSVEKSAAAARARHADTAVASAADSQRGAMESLRRAPSFPAPISRVDVTDGVTMISWVDATS
ncbi:MAG TPA: zf-HC2 domain-containing protein, partial [Gemmatimonadaceae bacterium]|nr:zf-HC2 domain-containing protein [Gemmatimonadaceae bacterium]